MHGHMQGEFRLIIRNNRDQFKGRNNGRRPDNNNRNNHEHDRKKYDDQSHQSRGFMNTLHAYKWTLKNQKADKTWLGFCSNDHFIWDRNVFETF